MVAPTMRHHLAAIVVTSFKSGFDFAIVGADNPTIETPTATSRHQLGSNEVPHYLGSVSITGVTRT
jgi:hypothetical protein